MALVLKASSSLCVPPYRKQTFREAGTVHIYHCISTKAAPIPLSGQLGGQHGSRIDFHEGEIQRQTKCKQETKTKGNI